MNRPFSHSSLSTYEQCPARYKFVYIDRIKKPFEGIESFVGRRVHEALQFLYEEVALGRLPIFDAIEDFYSEVWNEKIHNKVKVIKRRFSADYYLYMGRDCLSRYYRRHHPFNQSVKETEYSVVFKLDEDDNFEMKGILDRLDDLGGGRWEIHDYKTSRRAMSQADADRNRQLALYQIGIQKMLGKVESMELVWHFLQQGQEVRSKRTPRQLENLKRRIQRLVAEIKDKIESGGPFNPVETPLCNWCFFWEECPAKSGHNPVVKRGASA
ncbi:MAG: PD-(D/E)XK nuclease family protein [Candidatus Neomarinimicrobiota bacterium]|nr:PD-(D/E)XK nuclease family protein [Candidatus Neomarinimicrobiota bacterium]